VRPSIAKSNADVLRSTVVNAAPLNEIEPSGKEKPAGMAPVVEAVPPAFVLKSSVVAVSAVFSPNSRLIWSTGRLNVIWSGISLAPAGPGSSSTSPGKVWKKVGPIVKPPGSAGELNEAVTPLSVAENGVELPD
jgi:hypothetical protein